MMITLPQFYLILQLVANCLRGKAAAIEEATNNF